MTLAASGTLATGAKIQYLHTLVRGEALLHFDLLSDEGEGANPLTIKTVILGLSLYYFPLNSLLNKKRGMHRGIRKPHGLKVRQYEACLVGLNKYLGSFPGEAL